MNILRDTNFQIQNMSRNELNIAVEWAGNEGWNPGLHDADSFYATDPHGFFMGTLNGQPITCISAVAYDDTFGFIGLYICKPEFRGKGYGMQTWNQAMDYLKKQNVGLDGVADQQENYKKSGFKLAYNNARYRYLAEHSSVPEGKEILNLSVVALDDLVKYDNDCFPSPRTRFLQSWFAMPDSYGLTYVEKNEVAGYGVIRKCRTGYKIGPLFADNAKIANALYQSLCNQVEEGSEIFLDVPEINKAAVNLAESYGMNKVFSTTRMYTKPQPKIALHKIYGVTTLELG